MLFLSDLQSWNFSSEQMKQHERDHQENNLQLEDKGWEKNQGTCTQPSNTSTNKVWAK